MSSTFTHVVTSTGLAEPVADKPDCPRELLGRSCINDQYRCLCESVTESRMTVLLGDKGEPVGAELFLTSPWGGRVIAKEAIEGLELLGMAPDVEWDGDGVTATFNFKRALNYGLRDYLLRSR